MDVFHLVLRQQKRFNECIAIETVANVKNELINKTPLFMLSNCSPVAFVLKVSNEVFTEAFFFVQAN